ncbi:MAG: 4'-phosphopantetheinyl transferase superfamily protein [bacterium]
MLIHPVIYYLKYEDQTLSGREKVALLSQRSREALRVSAEKSGVVFGSLKKDSNGSPLPFRDNYWSLSHKSECVAAVVGKTLIGIDIEKIQPRSESLFDYIASQDEWVLICGDKWDFFFRIWTAKEAVLKATGVGLSGLKVCKLVGVPDEKKNGS